jgi:hypothetical protein
MRFHSRDDIQPGDVGRRVTIRRTLPEGGKGDVIGILESMNERTVRLRTKDGSLVDIPRTRIVAARIIG